ncbi:E3 binding domain-containing protein, partial [Streptomyces sp. CLV115]|uniref:E3 binding domain-containing protein n=1 Tax=Streptomyces sp. CLV115 TaxID=3138502 RepID=UPI00313E8504
MAELFRMPAVAADAATAVLSAWQVAEGASFTKDDALVSIETDKAEVDVSAERDGVLLKALYEAGVEIEVGDPIAVLGTVGEQTGDLDALLAELGVAAPGEARQAVRRDVPEEPVAPVPSAAPAPRVAPASGEPDRGGRIFSSPLARRLAREAGLGIETLTGTGPGGRIVRRDVEAAVAAGRAQMPEPPSPPAAAPVPQAPT